MPTRFKSLDGLGGFLHGVGIMVVILGSMVATVGLLPLMNTIGSNSASLTVAIGVALPSLGVAGAIILYGFFLAAFGQAMKCLVAIEENTRLALERAPVTVGNLRCPNCQAVNPVGNQQCAGCGRSLVSM